MHLQKYYLRKSARNPELIHFGIPCGFLLEYRVKFLLDPKPIPFRVTSGFFSGPFRVPNRFPSESRTDSFLKSERNCFWIPKGYFSESWAVSFRNTEWILFRIPKKITSESWKNSLPSNPERFFWYAYYLQNLERIHFGISSCILFGFALDSWVDSLRSLEGISFGIPKGSPSESRI